MRNKNGIAYLLLIFATLFWSGNFIVGKAASIYQIPPFSLNFYRWLFAGLILLPFTYKEIINNLNYIKSSPDFYTVSGVRDLLFHVQEHRFTISKIKEYLDKLGLIFLGFEDQLVKEKFKEIYSNRIDLYNLDKWEEYEKSNPRIFAGMYQFWCKKI